MKYFLLLWLCISYFFSGQVQAFTQAELAEFAKNTELKFAVKSNFTSAATPKGQVELILRRLEELPTLSTVAMRPSTCAWAGTAATAHSATAAGAISLEKIVIRIGFLR